MNGPVPWTPPLPDASLGVFQYWLLPIDSTGIALTEAFWTMKRSCTLWARRAFGLVVVMATVAESITFTPCTSVEAPAIASSAPTIEWSLPAGTQGCPVLGLRHSSKLYLTSSAVKSVPSVHLTPG